MPKYCATCNRSTLDVKFYGDFCEECTKKKFKVKFKDEVEIKTCKRCNKVSLSGNLVPPSTSNLELIIQKSFPKYSIHLLKLLPDDRALIELGEQTQDGLLKIEKEISISYKKTLCEQCYKKACNYHEAVIQLRGNPNRMRKFTEAVARFFDSHDEYITKIMRSDNGYDIYLSSKTLTSKFLSIMKLKPTISYTLYGIRNGKRVYKNTYAVHYD